MARGVGLQVRLAEVVGSLSLVTDLATGQPLEHGLRRSLLAMWLGEELGLRAADLSDAYYVALLGSVGCTIEGTVLAQLAADDIALSAQAATVDVKGLRDYLPHALPEDGASPDFTRQPSTIARRNPVSARQG